MSGCELTTHTEQNWFPVAVLPGQSTFELSITSGKFDADLFAMANATDYKIADGGSGEGHTAKYAMPRNERHEITQSHITLLETPVEGTVYIRGMEEVDAQPTAAGTYYVDYETKQVSFHSSEEGTVEVLYESLIDAYEAIITNKEAAIGEASCKLCSLAA